jgi:hypothetical protein
VGAVHKLTGYLKERLPPRTAASTPRGKKGDATYAESRGSDFKPSPIAGHILPVLQPIHLCNDLFVLPAKEIGFLKQLLTGMTKHLLSARKFCELR